MRIPAPVHRTLRGPVRTRVRGWQSRSALLAGRRRPGPPDYVGIGAQRCGTSWWHSLIEAHPGVDPLGLGAKELHFFDSRWGAEDAGAQIASYHSHFLRRPGQVVGEWTPRYMFDPWSVPMLMRCAPAARLIVLVRDPVARFVSGVRHAAARSGGRLDADAVTNAFARGLYAEQLAGVLASAPRDQVLVLQFERCVLEPRRRLADTFAFLGLDARPVPLRGEQNASGGTCAVPDSLIARVGERYTADARALEAMFPDDIDLGLWTRVPGR